MNSVAYEVYYSHEGQIQPRSLRGLLTPEAVALALQRFPDDLRHHLPAPDSSVSVTSANRTPNSISAVIHSSLAPSEIQAAVADSADSLQLYAKRLEVVESVVLTR
jgi:hypothetical protein